MPLTRRRMLVGTMGAMGLGLIGCSSSRPISIARGRPNVDWPSRIATPSPGDRGTVVVAPANPTHPGIGSQSYHPTLSVISRSKWTRQSAVAGRVNPMGSIDRITIHHEGWTPVYFTSAKTTAARIEQIRSIHVRDRGWGDIGYHYIVDRRGRIWEGRNIRYQGAHVKANNEHNIGILVLGNFDKQNPSHAQLATAIRLTSDLMDKYRVTSRRVYTHQELKPTRCPGRTLQPRFAAIRDAGRLA